LLSAHIVYGKYITVYKINSSLSIATPIFIVDGGEATKISEINNIGYYEFSIKNFNDTSISEIGFLYTIEILSNTDQSIQFELFNEEKQIPLDNLKTQELSISGGEKVEQRYKLKVIYDSSKGADGYDNLEEVQIKVHSEQTKV